LLSFKIKAVLTPLKPQHILYNYINIIATPTIIKNSFLTLSIITAVYLRRLKKTNKSQVMSTTSDPYLVAKANAAYNFPVGEMPENNKVGIMSLPAFILAGILRIHLIGL